MRPNIVVSLPAASSTEHLQALSEVNHFATTDMGHPGEGPWTFRMLPEPSLTAELKRIARPQSNHSRKVDSLTFQPCSPHIYQNQDRFVVEEWNFPGGTWQFNSIFDGHVNHYTVDYVAETLPRNLKNNLGTALRAAGNRQLSPQRISQILRDSIVQLDDSISSNFLDIFPRDLRRLSQMPDGAVQNMFERDTSGRFSRATARCLGGATVVLSLTDPNEKNLWVANLGVLGVRHHSGAWNGTLVNHIHAGHDHQEAQRIQAEHPREPESIKHGRVLGFLEPTRAIGDTWLKIPSLYTSRVFANFDQDWISQGTLKQCASRISTPPYVSNMPDVYHRDLPSRPWFLLLCSDGLSSAETYDGMDTASMTRSWTEFPPGVNTALSLLRAAIGGQDEQKVSRSLTVEMDERWMDDVSISIQRFRQRRP
ncbi:phosphatase 2C-like domain-containing protein [Mycena metata]|uniref:Phosphatase 2C-like domain-containing protein n=1 Tax=Mycena metata TaxID=1033252 RepID=A0AAD7P0U1_9AGAR|nr:phosphatase 2C-like domain-containing protein [Mycena metata]